MCSSQAGHFRINMYEPVSAFCVSDDHTHPCPRPLGSSSRHPPVALFILHLIHSVRCLDLWPILLLVTHSQCYFFISTASSLGQALIIPFLASCCIFTVFSPPGVSPPWFYSTWMRQALGSDCLYFNPVLGALPYNWKS